MSRLPSMVNTSKITRSIQTEFGTYNHTDSAMNGDIYDMENLSSDKFPLLASRKKRSIVEYGKELLALADFGKLFYLWEKNGDGEHPYKFGDKTGAIISYADGEKTVCALGSYIVIMPDKTYINTEDMTMGMLEAEFEAAGTFTIKNGTIYGEEAVANTIYCKGALFKIHFKVGDAVTISGCSVCSDNNKSVIIREITDEELVFYENTFTIPDEESSYQETGKIKIKREVPELDFMCENENRLWGCKGSTVYASKLGDIFNWNVYDGISTDSFSVSVGSPGDFTGCISYLGYPCFFKEDYIYKVYGDKPSNFQLMSTASSGVADGCGKSLAIAGETLFYMSRNGICAYTGGMPVNISRCFGDVVYSQAVGGSDGIKYYVSVKDADGAFCLFVYDTRFGVWHKEDNSNVCFFARSDGVLYMALANGNVMSVNGPEGNVEGDVEWMCEFASLYEYSSSRSVPSKKGIVRFYIRAELEDGAYMDAEIKYDSEDEWQKVGTVNATKKRTCILPIIPRRADHFKLKLSGKGKCTIFSITREYYVGSFI